VFVYNGAVDVVNAIITGNIANSGADLYRYNLNAAVTVNLISSLTNTTAANSGVGINGANSSNLAGDPLLGTLLDNGGWTRTMALQPGSPAIDAIAEGGNAYNNAPVLDQTGYARAGNYDMGAVEAGKLAQIIAFDAIADMPFIDVPFTVSATGGGSGNPVTFTIVSGPATATGENGATIALTGMGPVTIQAAQAGSGAYLAALNVERTFTVGKSLTATAVVSDHAQAIPDDVVTFTATVTDSIAASAPTGTVIFRDGGVLIGEALLDVSGQAVLAASNIASGNRTITAEYAGDDNFSVSASAPLVQTVIGRGDLNADGMIDIVDALKALRLASGVDTATEADLHTGDVAPLAGGTPAPDGNIDIGDVVVILRRTVGLTNW
jgi:hypothetical protein